MELVSLARYMPVRAPSVVLPFSELRKMEPLWLSHELALVDEPENVAMAESMAARGLAVVPVRRRPPFAKFLSRTTFPRRILLELTTRCNFLCRMCPQQNLQRARIDMPWDLCRRILDEVDTHGVEGVWLYHLGESLLHPEFREIVRHVSTKKNLGVIWMSTNGRYFTETHIRNVLDSNIDYVNFSAHAVTEATYNTVVSGHNFPFVQTNLETLYTLKSRSNGRANPDSNRLAKPFIRVQMIEQETTKHEVEDFIKKHYSRADIVSINMLEHVNLPANAFGHQQRERKPLTSCLRVSRNDCLICSTGEVTPCDEAYNGEVYLGNVGSESLYDIWNGDKRRAILELAAQGRMSEIEFCRKCTDYDI